MESDLTHWARPELIQHIKRQEAEVASLRSELLIARRHLGAPSGEGVAELKKLKEELAREVSTTYLLMREKKKADQDKKKADQEKKKAQDLLQTAHESWQREVQGLKAEYSRLEAEVVELRKTRERGKEDQAVLETEVNRVVADNGRVLAREGHLRDLLGEKKRENARMEARIADMVTEAKELEAARVSSEKVLAKVQKERNAEQVRLRRERDFKSRMNDGLQFYHMVLRIPHLLDAARQPGWPLRTVQGFDMGRCRAIPVTILGGFNKGKTYIFTRLANELSLQSGTSVETEGISVRIARLQDTREVMLIDTAGKGQAIQGWTPDKSKEAQAKEEFITQVAHHMAQVYIYVAEFIEEQDQGRLHELLANILAAQRSGTVVVVHNMRNITDLEEWNDRKNYLVDLFIDPTEPSTWEHIQNVRVPIFDGGREGTVEYLTGPNQRHYFLGCDDFPSGQNNQYVFKSIMDFIGHVGSCHTSVEERLLTSLNAYINRHYSQHGKLKIVDEEGNPVVLSEEPTPMGEGAPVPIGAEGAPTVERYVRWFRSSESSDDRDAPVLRSGAAGVSGATGAFPTGTPTESQEHGTRCNVWELKDNRMVVQVDAPLVEKGDLKVEIDRTKGIHLTVSGTRGSGYYTTEHSDVRTGIRTTAYSKEFKVGFDVRSEFQVPPLSQIVQNMVLHNGVLQFEFLPWDDDEEEEDEA